MKTNKKGFTLIEVVVVIAILGVISSIIYSVFQFSIDSYHSGTKQIVQQDKVIDIIQMVRSHVEEAKSIKYEANVLILSPDHFSADKMGEMIETSNRVKCWKFEGGKLVFKPLGSISYEEVINDLDTTKSSFNINNEKLIISIKPNELNKKYKNRNITEPVISEISVRYKIVD